MSIGNSAIVRRFVDEFLNQGDEAALHALVSDGFACHVAGGLAGGTTGPEAWRRRRAALTTSFPDFHIIIDEILIDGDRAVPRYHGQGTHQGPIFGAAPSGAAMTYTGIMIVRIVNGQIAEEWTEYDQAGMLRQLGVLSAD